MENKYEITDKKLKETMIDKVFGIFMSIPNNLEIEKDFLKNGEIYVFTKQAANSLYASFVELFTKYAIDKKNEIEKKIAYNKKRAYDARIKRLKYKAERHNNPEYIKLMEVKEQRKKQRKLASKRKKMEIIIDQFVESGDTPMTCIEVCKAIAWKGDVRSIARQLRYVFGAPSHTRIDGIQGKYYFLKLKEK